MLGIGLGVKGVVVNIIGIVFVFKGFFFSGRLSVMNVVRVEIVICGEFREGVWFILGVRKSLIEVMFFDFKCGDWD